jgi:hypothetical protein
VQTVCRSLLALLLSLSTVLLFGQSAPGTRVLMDAHNCYPYSGHWMDRIDRALSTGEPLAIEQDVALYTDPVWHHSRVVVTHDSRSLTGSEPSLRGYFFERIRPVMERALRNSDHTQWPLVTLNLDFKSDDPALITEVHHLLAMYKSWLTTAARGKNAQDMQPLKVGPLLVLTGESDTQQRIFHDEIPVGSDLLVFGAVHVNRQNLMAAPETLVSVPANNYRRWWNNAWSVVEEGGQTKAGDWTAQDQSRLQALVQHAHRLGYWIRFYTLDGGSAEQFRTHGWFDGYNFGSLSAAELRWKAAEQAGADFIASDHYESVAKTVKRHLVVHRLTSAQTTTIPSSRQ